MKKVQQSAATIPVCRLTEPVELQILKVSLNLSLCHEFKCTFSTFNDV